MNRYFLEVCYLGTHYSGFQVQQNANSIQSEIEKALKIFLRRSVQLTGSSRTDSGVHALQNFFHFDFPEVLQQSMVYNLNSLLPADISVIRLHNVNEHAHCRFDAIAREYVYTVYRFKNPFLTDRGYYYPYSLNFDTLNHAASVLLGEHDFSSFSKRNTQVKTYICNISISQWQLSEDVWQYRVRANRFLRGMVRGLVGTMLQVGRGKMQIDALSQALEARDSSLVDFSVPGKGLMLHRVVYSAEMSITSS